MNLNSPRTLILGGTGFLGSAISNKLPNAISASSKGADLRSYSECQYLFQITKPNIVINCAAKQGGILYNKTNPVEIMENNLQIGINVIHACAEFEVRKLTNISASCAYPDGLNLLSEDLFLDGRSHESVAYHSAAKRCIYELGRAYNKQFNLNVINLCLTNLYGPGCQKWGENDSKVVEAAIRKIVDAKINNKPTVEFWGQGKELREFLYIEDAANLVIKATNEYNCSDILNIGSGHEISIKWLVKTIVDIIGYKGKVVWLTEKGDGQLKKLLDSSKMKKLFPSAKFIHLKTGLRNTIQWYTDSYLTK